MADVVIYTREFCSYCTRAKSLLDEKRVKYDEIDITNDQVKQQQMIERSGRLSTPQIFINDQPIGGCDDLYGLEEQGKLDTLLNF